MNPNKKTEAPQYPNCKWDSKNVCFATSPSACPSSDWNFDNGNTVCIPPSCNKQFTNTQTKVCITSCPDGWMPQLNNRNQFYGYCYRK